MVQININRKKMILLILGAFLLIFVSGCSRGSTQLNLGLFNKEKIETFKSKDNNFLVGLSNRWEVLSESEDENILLALKSEEYSSNYLLEKEDKTEYAKDMTLDKYSLLVGEAASMGLENGFLDESEDIIIDNMDGKKFLVKGEKEGIKLTYIFTVLDSEDIYLKQIVWSSSKNIDDNNDYYYKILGSLKKNVETSE